MFVRTRFGPIGKTDDPLPKRRIDCGCNDAYLGIVRRNNAPHTGAHKAEQGNDMNYEQTSPSAAEMYFNHSIFGQLYTLIAEALQRGAPRRTAATRGREDAQATWLDRLDGWFWRQQQAEREAYLAASADVFELERRLEALDRGRGARYY